LARAGYIDSNVVSVPYIVSSKSSPLARALIVSLKLSKASVLAASCAASTVAVHFSKLYALVKVPLDK